MRNGNFAGRLAADCVLKTLPSGKEVVNFTLAVDKNRGENKETLWVDCSLWGERAAKIGPYLVKGKQIAVSGDVDFRLYEKKDGTPGGNITCDVKSLTLMGSRESGEQQQAPVTTPQAGPKTPPMRPSSWGETPPKRPAPPKESELDDEIPFSFANWMPATLLGLMMLGGTAANMMA